MLSAVANLQTQQTQMLLALKEIIEYNRKLSLDNLVEPDNIPSFPLKSFEDFLHFEELIHEDEVAKQYMMRRLAALGGSSIEGITRRIMKFLITNDIAVQFNWKGRNNKRAFEHTRTMGIIYDAAKQTFPSSEHNDLLVSKTVRAKLHERNNRGVFHAAGFPLELAANRENFFRRVGTFTVKNGSQCVRLRCCCMCKFIFKKKEKRNDVGGSIQY